MCAVTGDQVVPPYDYLSLAIDEKRGQKKSLEVGKINEKRFKRNDQRVYIIKTAFFITPYRYKILETYKREKKRRINNRKTKKQI